MVKNLRIFTSFYSYMRCILLKIFLSVVKEDLRINNKYLWAIKSEYKSWNHWVTLKEIFKIRYKHYKSFCTGKFDVILNWQSTLFLIIKTWGRLLYCVVWIDALSVSMYKIEVLEKLIQTGLLFVNFQKYLVMSLIS